MTRRHSAGPGGRFAPNASAVTPFAVAAALVVLVAPHAASQQSPTPSSSAVQLSGLLFPYFRYGGGAGSRSQSRFDVERAYVNVRATLGGGLGAAVTADIFRQSDTSRADYYGGWALRAKYAYLQYDALRGDDSPPGLRGFARLGLINTIVIGHVDDYWPRWISKTAVDRYDFMSSADAGASFQLTTAGGHAEMHASITNGEGYQRGEVDRFKDYAARLTLRPFASRATWPSRLVITPWGSLGARGSRFVNGLGTVQPVSRGLDRNMWGFFVGYRSPALTLGADLAARLDETEEADTSADPVPTFADETERVASGFLLARPFALLDPASQVPLGIVLRYDRRTHTNAPDGHGDLVIAGVTWDMSTRVSLALDYQGETTHGGFPGQDARVWFLHAVARF